MRSFLFLFLFVFSLAAPAQATPKLGIACIQQQMAEAGYDPGPIDGILGRRTRGALAKFADARGFQAKPRLQRFNAMSYCRRIGIDHPELRVFWPINEGRFTYQVDDKVEPVVAGQIRRELKRAHDHLTAQLGLELAGTDTVVVATNVRDLQRLIKRHAGYPIGDITAALREQCSFDIRLGAGVIPGLVYFCADPTLTDQSNWRVVVRAVASHEMVHLVQTQVSGMADISASQAERMRREGPIWLIEGIAEVLSIQDTHQVPVQTIKDVMLAEYAEQGLPDLRRLEPRGALARHKLDVYQVGTLGAADLVLGHGPKTYGAFLESLARGVAWKDAFAQVYGQSTDAFYTGFQATHGF